MSFASFSCRPRVSVAPRVELPAGYNQAWTNGNEFILSNDPRFDPAGVGGGGWTPMERDQR